MAPGVRTGQLEPSVKAARIERESYAGVSDIPPVTTCARCGLATCEGCAPAEPAIGTTGGGARLPWTERPASLKHLLDTALATSTDVQLVFGRLEAEPPGRALWFALTVELLALGSIFAAVGFGLLLAAPRFFLALARQGSTWAWSSGLWLVASLGVVALHLLWAELLERGVRRADHAPSHRLAVAFACYSCGWDLLTSPVGFWLSARSGALRGQGRTHALVSALRAPRPAMLAYLVDGRGLDEATAAQVIRGAARDAFVLVGLFTLLCVGAILGFLVALWPY